MKTVTDEALEKMRQFAQSQVPLTPAMNKLMKKLQLIATNPVVEAAFNEAVAHVNPTTESGMENPWKYFTINNFVEYFGYWFTYLPGPTGGLGYIVPFTWFYLNNTSAYYFLNTFKS